MKQCENGHFYDENRFAECPYCKNGAGTHRMEEEPVGKTVAAYAAPAVEEGKTVGIIQKKIGIDPAVGFLICISGPDRGSDYRLISGRNFIGRSPSMDIALTGDVTVSRDSHALVTYDEKYNRFSLSPGQGRGITYCNGEQVELPRALEAYDIIEVGKSRLLFLPLCGERFRWDGE
jgi:pSer/pThr/pTyr-binding forkhead associated (FHA) protein